MKVVEISKYRLLKHSQAAEAAYKHKLAAMDKVALLGELLKYHESYQKDPLDLSATIRGQYLMEVLESRAELAELSELSREFQHKLKVRLYRQLHILGA